MLRPTSLRTTALALVLSLSLILTGCAGAKDTAPPSPTSTISTPSEIQKTEAVSAAALPGSAFNAFFPATQNGFERVYTQEKDGFAEAKLKQDGSDVAKLAISDTISTPAAAQKFANVSDAIAGYPALSIGSQQTAILVNDRFQVKVISVADSFTADDRSAWLQKFDLKGLSELR
ncbi:MAG: hypothetical protein EAZ61_02445 [Oscillatoriales cyanobacterium]|nr:MAG: hypothetical protein EAZ61_02445 [Oscillatoriales cyanobacterium]